MDSRLGTRIKDDSGFVTIEFLVAVAFSLVLFTAFANLVVVQYARGVVRSALDEGVRDGSRALASRSECEATAEQWLSGLLGGSMGDGVEITCAESGGRVSAVAEVEFPSWFAGVPSWRFTMEAEMVKDGVP